MAKNYMKDHGMNSKKNLIKNKKKDKTRLQARNIWHCKKGLELELQLA